MQVHELQVGDLVVIKKTGTHRPEPFMIHTVTRVTKTQITLDNGERYVKKSGYRLGDAGSWYPRSLAYSSYIGRELMAADEARERNKAIHKEQARLSMAVRLSRFKWRTLDYDMLLNIMRLIPEVDEEA